MIKTTRIFYKKSTLFPIQFKAPKKRKTLGNPRA
nr:MAG TPA: hypothetical protein [Caudoviricetes sp.]